MSVFRSNLVSRCIYYRSRQQSISASAQASKMSLKIHIPRFFQLLFVLALGLCLNARAEQLPLKLYSSAEGLSTGSILHILRDSRGFLWFSTRAGLSRFDGQEFVNFRFADQSGVTVVNSTYETRDGSFWISGAGGTYRSLPEAVIDAATIQTPTRENTDFQIFRAQNLSPVVFLAMFEDSRGRLWGANGDLFLIAENGELRMQKFDLGEIARGLHGYGVTAFAETADGSLWFGCQNGVLRLLPDNRRLLYPIKSQTNYDGARRVVEDTSGRIWVAHTTGAFVFKPESLGALADAADLSVRFLNLEEKLVTPAGSAMLPDEPGTMLRLLFSGSRDDASPDAATLNQTRNVERIFKSSDGKIWIPTGGGLFVFDGRRMNYLSDTNGFPGTVTSIAEDAENNI